MALPKIAIPRFSLTLPSSGQTIDFRPFLVKEEKTLLIASESKDTRQMIMAMNDIIDSCVLTLNFKVDKLPFFDAEFLFLNLRAKSVGEIVKLFYHHAEGVNLKGEPCAVSTPVEINLENVKVNMDAKPDNKIMLTDSLGLVLRFPSIDDVTLPAGAGSIDEMSLVAKCIVHAFDATEIYEPENFDEALKFVESLTAAQFAKIGEFFDKMPEVSHSFIYKCDGCGQEDKITLKGIADFF